MALSQPRQIFGIHSVSPYSRTDGTFYGIMKVLKGSTLSMSGELVESFGGSSKFAWAAEDGQTSAEASVKCSQFEDFMFELFLGKKPTAAAASTTGTVSAIANVKGTSMVAATGMASVGIKTGGNANLKFGKYIVKAVNTTTVDVYESTDIDLTRGTDATYQDDLLKLTASALTITTGTAVEIPTCGLELTGGAGTIGMVAGDTASFEVLPIHSGSSEVIVGGAADVLPEFGMIIMAQKRGNGELVELDAFRCKASGMGIPFEAQAWAETEIKIKLLYDSAKNGLFKMRAVKA